MSSIGQNPRFLLAIILIAIVVSGCAVERQEPGIDNDGVHVYLNIPVVEEGEDLIIRGHFNPGQNEDGELYNNPISEPMPLPNGVEMPYGFERGGIYGGSITLLVPEESRIITYYVDDMQLHFHEEEIEGLAGIENYVSYRIGATRVGILDMDSGIFYIHNFFTGESLTPLSLQRDGNSFLEELNEAKSNKYVLGSIVTFDNNNLVVFKTGKMSAVPNQVPYSYLIYNLNNGETYEIDERTKPLEFYANEYGELITIDQTPGVTENGINAFNLSTGAIEWSMSLRSDLGQPEHIQIETILDRFIYIRSHLAVNVDKADLNTVGVIIDTHTGQELNLISEYLSIVITDPDPVQPGIARIFIGYSVSDPDTYLHVTDEVLLWGRDALIEEVEYALDHPQLWDAELKNALTSQGVELADALAIETKQGGVPQPENEQILPSPR